MLESGVTSDDGSQTRPPMSGAGTVLITGSSAGCAGVANQADRVSQSLIESGKDVRIICDGNFPPSETDFGFVQLPEAARAAFAAGHTTRRELMDAQLDESCLAAEIAEPWRCSLVSHVLRNYIESGPLFIRTRSLP